MRKDAGDQQPLPVQASIIDQDLLMKIKWLTTIRIIVATIILGSITILQLRDTQTSLTPIYHLITIIYAVTILYALIFRFSPPPLFFAYTQLIGDIIIETALIFATGGIKSPFSFIYIMTIISTSIILARKSSLIIASLSSLAYATLLIFQSLGLVAFPLNPISHSLNLNLPYISHTIFANVFAFYLTAFLSGHLKEMQKKAGKALERKDGDLAQLQSFNENILQSMSSGLMVTDLMGGVRLMNKAALRLLESGLTTAENLQQHWNEIFKPLEIKQILQMMLEQEKDCLRLESTINRKGQEQYLGITVSFLKNPQGEAGGLITNFQDLTDLKKMEEQVKKAEMLATIGQMAAGMAHELRNPMASLKGSVQFLHDELELNEEQKTLMKIILKESDRLNNIVTDFLTYAKPKPPSLKECSMPDLLQETIALLKNNQAFKENISLDLDLPPALPQLEIDPDQIKQVFWNLSLNACQAMPEGGRLRIQVFASSNNNLLIEFADTGMGIDLNNMKKLFTPFYTTKEKGMGLGLSIACRIIEEHKGKIEVMSAPGEGSIFRIYLPLQAHICAEAL